MTLLAKFICKDIYVPLKDSATMSVEFVPAEDNDRLGFLWIPSGSVTLRCEKTKINDQFVVGKEYCITFIPV